MHSLNKPAMTKHEREYIELVKSLPCSVCDKPGPSEAHEIKQGSWRLTIALCADCHRGSFNGLHGQRRIWSVMKLDELDALAITIERVMERAK